MSFSALFSRLKGLGPVAVVGTAVAITVKLLTTQTPTSQEELKVDAEEDIELVDFKDEIAPPPPPEEPPKSDVKEDEEEKETEEAGEETEEESSSSSSDSQTQEAQAQQEQESQTQENPKPSSRRWKPSNGNKLIELFQRLLPKDKK